MKPITTIPEKAILFSTYTALGYTGAEFGQLKKNDPVKHSILYEIRKGAQAYQSNRLKDLQRMAGKILDEQNPDQKTTRTEKLFTETVEKVFGDWAKQVRNKPQVTRLAVIMRLQRERLRAILAQVLMLAGHSVAAP